MSGTITAQQYTEKSYVIRGDVWPHADLLSKFGKYCHNLKSGGPGWIVSAKKFAGFKDSIDQQGIPYMILAPNPSLPSFVSHPSLFPPSSPSNPTIMLTSSYPVPALTPTPTYQPSSLPYYVGTPITASYLVSPPKYRVVDVEAMSHFELTYYLVNNSGGEVSINGDESLDTLRCLVLVEMANHRGNVEPGLRNLIKVTTFNKIAAMSNLQVAVALKRLGIKYVGLTFSRLVALVILAAYEEGSGGISSRYRELLVSLDPRLKEVLSPEDYEGYSDEEKEKEVQSLPLPSPLSPSLPPPVLPVDSGV
jgi:hypothetical protein